MSKKLFGSLAMAATLFVAGQQVVFAANQVVTQQELTPGTSVTVAGVKYKIIQFEVPSFGSDKIYLISFPVESPATGYFSSYVSAYGSTGGQDNYMPHTINAGSTGLSGFKAFYDEGYNYNASYNRFSNQSTLNNALSLTNTVGIQIDSKTFVTLSLANKTTTQTVNTSSAASDTTTKLQASPTVLTKAQRDKFLVDSRALFKYVIIKEKN